MKKKAITALLLCALMLSGCGNTAGTGEPSQTLAEETPSGEEQSSSLPFGGDMPYETVYENDFSSASAEDIMTLGGKMEIKDGMLRAEAGRTGGYSTVLFNIGEFSDFVYEADFVGHVGGGGLVFLCNGEKIKNTTDGFCGYMAYIGKDGGVGALGVATNDGKWSGNFMVSPSDVTSPGADLHLRVRSSGNYIIYTLTDKNSGKEIYRCEYIKGDNKKYDLTPNREGMIGVRIYNDGGKGGFDNIKLYKRKQLAEDTLELLPNQRLSAAVKAETAENFVALTRGGTGYVLSYDAAVERLVLYSAENGELKYYTQCALSLEAGREYPLEIHDLPDRLSVYFANRQYPVFEIPHSEGEYTVKATAVLSALITDAEGGIPEDYYQNPVADGADPEILYYEGTYYLYTSHSKKVRVRTSKDLVSWKDAGYAFSPIGKAGITSFMSPNVFYSDGLFYLIIASRTGGSTSSTDFKLYYASSPSPTGPFEMKSDKPYINDVNEIGGAPFIDDDGKIYMSSVRFGGGNNIYIQELSAKGGIITPVTEAVHCISPTEHYEIDGYGRISEGGVIIKHNGWYYMMYASGHYKGHYGEAYAVSRSLLGPWEKHEYNDVLTHTPYADGVGDCVFVRTAGGELFVAYHKHTSVGNEGASRSICIDRAYFVPSEKEGEPDVLCVFGPTGTKQPKPR